MLAPLCVCPLAPRLEARTHVIVWQDGRERNKTTNTGRLAALALARCTVLARDQDPLAALQPGERPLLLFPDAAAAPLCDPPGAQRVALVVPDASWRHAARMVHAAHGLRAVPRVRLPAGPPGRFTLRHAGAPDRLCTLEAIARALGVLEHAGMAALLEAWLQVFVDRTRWTRGDLPADAVSGGIPVAARAFRGVRIRPDSRLVPPRTLG